MGENNPLTISYIHSKLNGNLDNLHTLGDYLKHYAETLQDKEAFVFASRSKEGKRESVTWKELYLKSIKVAKSLVTQGVKREEFVAINIRPCPEWLFLAFGVMFAGARIAPIYFTYMDGSDLLAIMKKLGTCCMLAFDPGEEGKNLYIVQKFVEHFQKDGSARSTHMPYLRYLLGHGIFEGRLNVKTVKDMLAEDLQCVELPHLNAEDIFVVLNSSGTTGSPKLVAHTHSLIKIRDHSQTDQALSTRVFNNRPFHWLGGFPGIGIVGMTRVTTSCYGPPADDLTRIIEVIEEEKSNVAFLRHHCTSELIKRKDQLPSNRPLILIISSGGPTTSYLVSAIWSVCKMMLIMYVTTETSLIASHLLTQQESFKTFLCGKVVEGNGIELKIIEDDGETLPVNTTGEICVRSQGLFKEYYGDPEKTSAALTQDGWYKTDDIGRLTNTGELYVEGRKSDVILSEGRKVFPANVERLLNSCEDVEAAVVVPIPDSIDHQRLCACVIRKEGSQLTEEQLRTFCEREHNDRVYLQTILPTFYLFMDSFPETNTGKYARKELEKIATRAFSTDTNRN